VRNGLWIANEPGRKINIKGLDLLVWLFLVDAIDYFSVRVRRNVDRRGRLVGVPTGLRIQVAAGIRHAHGKARHSEFFGSGSQGRRSEDERDKRDA
jgi:hypothetical protein